MPFSPIEKGNSERHLATREDNRRQTPESLKVTARDTQQIWETTEDMEQLQNSKGDSQWHSATGDIQQLQNPKGDGQRHPATMGDNRRHGSTPEF